MQTRSVVIFAPGGIPKMVVEMLSAANWDVRGTSNGMVARQLIRAGNPLVGVVVLSHADEARSPSLLQTLRESRQVEWVALCKAGVIECVQTPALILDWCFDHLTLPVDATLLGYALGHAHGRALLRQYKVREEIPHCALPQIVARSEVMMILSQQVKRYAAADSAVFIGGESGTGKELVARAIHRLSGRQNEPFVAINCGGLPATLIQSELFGSEKGAFTGAQQTRKGLLETAHGGTVFLDEIGDLMLEQQANLLRFLETKTINRLGSTASIQVDVRVIAATNVDLPAAVREGRFREDLYHRLNVLSLTVPALRERLEDIELLAEHFFQEYSTHHKQGRAKGFSASALQAMLDHSWPGNVRELMNRVNRAVVLSEGLLISPEDLDLSDKPGDLKLVKLDIARGVAERDAIRSCLLRTENNISNAARELGVSRVTLYRLLAKHGITVSEQTGDG